MSSEERPEGRRTRERGDTIGDPVESFTKILCLKFGGDRNRVRNLVSYGDGWEGWILQEGGPYQSS